MLPAADSLPPAAAGARHPCRDCQEELYAPARAEKKHDAAGEVPGGFAFSLSRFLLIFPALFSGDFWPMLLFPPLAVLGIGQLRRSGQHKAAAQRLYKAARAAHTAAPSS